MKRKNGFTLLELLVATSLTVILLLGVSSVFMTFMLTEVRTNVRRQVQAEGAEIISRMDFLIRNSKTLASCTTANSIQFTTVEQSGGASNTITLSQSGTDVRYQLDTAAGLGTPVALNSADSQINSLSFACTEDAATGKRVVIISFNLVKTSGGNTATENFKSYVQLRNS